MSASGIGTSALLAFQRAIGTTSNNIANSATEGYSRQRTELSNLTPQFLGGSFQGQGVQVDTIRRISDDFVNTQLRNSISDQSNAELKASLAGRIDDLLGSSSSGLTPVLQDFFDAGQDLANDPTSSAARTVFLTEAESLAERFASIDRRIEEQRDIINGQIRTNVDEINSLTEAVAGLNREIVSKSTQGTPNDLLDQRDRVLNQLAEKVNVRITEQDDGAVNVFVGNGQALVLGGNNRELVAESLTGDPRSPDIGLATSGDPVNISRFIQGGELGALLETRTGIIDEAQNTLGRLAISIGEEFNQQNNLGLDLEGNLGADIFGISDPTVRGFPGNESGGVPEVEITDVRAMTTSDYRLRNVGGEYELTRLSDGTSETFDNGVLEFDGIKVNIGEITNAVDGDEWLIQPTRNGARDLSVEMTDPSRIAAAAAVRADLGEDNKGDATIASVRAVDADALDLDSVTVEFDGDGFVVDGDDDPTVETGPDGVTTIAFKGWEMEIRGTPAEGDTFVVRSNEDHPGDNRNMLAMNDLSDERLVGGDRTFGDGYNSLLANVGTRTRQAQVAQESADAQLEQARAQREAVSGVNLDEEAADLIRYQQAYQAAAQVISVSNSLFDTLLGAVRR
ncbi:flagellar hook-associated protein FlgK [Thioalkalivibrio versutus]|uniref:flagellar hook-associated protein FlgK n=1 Tax=Thioalkalivibrio versutus TaxID=106634 RepID=UPI00037BF5CE|nr:flagellar hook-associated protein FlgK [Thioalkalivibrio versutus]OOC51136.1 flagellar hook-associated protein FlgK [Thioalkalivibrio versutus]